ncbi:hypothetical protein MGEO_19155 [Marivita geojedonensis]|uniref:HTH cro/C1-type domain-containing protein n=1 Tax=Marivita geojedonensis TaxID=1123756 RepID=A0A1X4NCE9_9RHOB|nr:hypothetical protein MGEO_19155 [Marivita geojedonensis]
MITGNQIRIARFALRWSVTELSEKSGVSVRTLKRIEATDSVPSASASTVQEIKKCLETSGIEFIGTPDDRPGIRIGEPKIPRA